MGCCVVKWRWNPRLLKACFVHSLFCAFQVLHPIIVSRELGRRWFLPSFKTFGHPDRGFLSCHDLNGTSHEVHDHLEIREISNENTCRKNLAYRIDYQYLEFSFLSPIAWNNNQKLPKSGIRNIPKIMECHKLRFHVTNFNIYDRKDFIIQRLQ